MPSIPMREYRDSLTRSRVLIGGGWCIDQDTKRAYRDSGDRRGLTYRGRTVDVDSLELEACDLGLTPSERHVYVQLRREGKQVLRAGWPDLLVIDGDEVYAVEVKTPADKVSSRQAATHEALAKAGLRVDVEVVR